MDWLDVVKKPDTLLSFSECHNGDEFVEIYKTARGSYRVIHGLIGEDPHSGDWERLVHERICDSGPHASNFLLETMDTVFGDAPWYITEALEAASAEDEDFGY